MRKRIALLCLVAALGLASCASLEPYQEAELEDIRSHGLPERGKKSPVVAGVLNVGPGFGDAYNGEWGAFVCNLLLWPISVAWGVPEAAVTAHNLNDQATWAYYAHGQGKEEYEAAKLRDHGSP